MWFRKFTILNQISNKVVNQLLANIDLIMELEGENARTINRKVHVPLSFDEFSLNISNNRWRKFLHPSDTPGPWNLKPKSDTIRFHTLCLEIFWTRSGRALLSCTFIGMGFANSKPRVEQSVLLYLDFFSFLFLFFLLLFNWSWSLLSTLFLFYLGGLYYAVKNEGVIRDEDLEVITLLNKTSTYIDDLKEIFEFVAEDINALGIGFLSDIP